jgi:SAM-dependent methyltransferase
MSFTAPAESYDAFMGRYSSKLAPLMADFAGVTAGQNVLDVGCGPGALTAELVRRLGANNVSAVDPAPQFVAAARQRNPGVRVEQAPAESLPFDHDSFDVAIAQLVVHFMSDPVAGLREMARVTRARGVVAASVWDFAGERSPLSIFWRAARELDANATDESHLAGARAGHLTELFTAAGLREVKETALVISHEHASFDEWWEPYTGGVGPAGRYLTQLPKERLTEIREVCRRALPVGRFTLEFRAWAARGEV